MTSIRKFLLASTLILGFAPGMAGALSVHSRYSARAVRVWSLQEIALGGCKPSSAAQKAGAVAMIPSAG